MKTKQFSFKDFPFSAAKIVLMLLLFGATFTFGQNLGDFKSRNYTSGQGNWNDYNTWYIYSTQGGVTDWFPAVTGQWPGATGYKGKNIIIECYGNNVAPVTISNGDYYVGTSLIVKGSLQLSNSQNIRLINAQNPNLTVNTTTNLDLPMDIDISGGQISWIQNADFAIPANSSVTISPTNKCNTNYGFVTQSNCNTSQNLYIGNVLYSNCSGKGQAVAGSFGDVNNSGGSFLALGESNNNTLCKGGTTLLHAYTQGLTPKFGNVNYKFEADPGNPSGVTGFTPINGTVTNTTNPATYNNVGVTQTLTFANDGIYKYKLTVTRINVIPNVVLTYEIVIEVGQESVYDGTTWSKLIPSTTNQRKAKITGFYNTITAGSFKACSCEVTTSGSLSIGPDSYVEVLDNIVNNGSIVIESDGNLLQKLNTGTFSGNNITAKRAVTDMDNVLSTQMDYVYWSSPVTSNVQTIQQFSPGTPANRLYQYNEANDYFIPTTDQYFVKAKGYAIRAEESATYPQNAVGYNKTYEFIGIPNNGDISINIKRSADTGTVIHGYNLVGNPYPSNIDFNVLYSNNSTLIYNTAWFWTNSTYQINMGGSNYSGNNYAVYNGTGGNNATYSLGTTAPNGIVKVGQGFIIQVRKPVGTNETLNFKNIYQTGDQLRTTATGTFYQRNSSEKDRFWLKLINPAKVINGLLVGYVAGSTNSYEQDYDAEAFDIYSDLFYSKLGDKNLLIQGRGLFSDADQVNLGANFYSNGSYTIELDNSEGIFANGQDIFLKDNLKGTVTNLKEKGYTFTANKGISEGRFEIVYRPSSIFLATDYYTKEELLVYRDGVNFVIKSKTAKITGLELYDGSGKLVYKAEPHSTEATINTDYFSSGFYILRINQNGRTTDKKIIK